MTASRKPDRIVERRRDLLGKIDQYGYTMIVVGTGECAVPGCRCEPEPYPYGYSLGMFAYDDHPEIVVFGVPLASVNNLVKPVYQAAAAGRPFTVGRDQRHLLGNGVEISLVPVPDLWVGRDPGRIGGWLDLFGDRGEFPSFLQICWADRRGAMPWEFTCNPRVAHAQPVLADDPIRYPQPPRNTTRHSRRR